MMKNFLFNTRTFQKKLLSENLPPLALSDVATKQWVHSNRLIYFYTAEQSSKKVWIGHLFEERFSNINDKIEQKNEQWFGTDKGLWIYNDSTQTIEQYQAINTFKDFKNSIVYHIQQKDEGHYWLGTEQGLFLLSLEKGIIAQYHQSKTDGDYLPLKMVNHLKQMTDGTLWLATDNGIIHWNPQKNFSNGQHYRHFSQKEGLLSNGCTSIYSDDYGFIWVGTNKGIVQLHAKTGQLKVYNKKNGLGLDYFEFGHHQATDGTIYLGALGGFVFFHPKDFKDENIAEADVALNILDFELYHL